MYPFRNILVAIDSAEPQQGVLDRAAEYAAKHCSKLTVVDCVPEIRWAAKLILSHAEEHLPELLAREKSERLKKLIAPIRKRGVNAKHRVLVGRASLEITKQVIRNKHDLVMKVAKGSHSRQSGFLGTTAQGLLRNCPCTVYLHQPGHQGGFRHAVAAVDSRPGDHDHEELNACILQIALGYCRDEATPLEVVSASGIVGGAYLGSYAYTDEYRSMLASTRAESQQNLHSLMASFPGVSPDRVHLLDGEASVEVPAYVASNNIDLLVLGTVARRGIAGFFVGNTAEVILGKVACSVLAVKPVGFVSPVKSSSRRSASATLPG